MSVLRKCRYEYTDISTYIFVHNILLRILNISARYGLSDEMLMVHGAWGGKKQLILFNI